MDSISHIVDNRGKSLSTASMHRESNKIHLASLNPLPGLIATRNHEKEEMVNIYRREEQFRRLRNLSDTGEEVQFSDASWNHSILYQIIGIPTLRTPFGRMHPKKSQTSSQAARPWPSSCKCSSIMSPRLFFYCKSCRNGTFHLTATSTEIGHARHLSMTREIKDHELVRESLFLLKIPYFIVHISYTTFFFKRWVILVWWSGKPLKRRGTSNMRAKRLEKVGLKRCNRLDGLSSKQRSTFNQLVLTTPVATVTQCTSKFRISYNQFLMT